jgi:hypothetical protein
MMAGWSWSRIQLQAIRPKWRERTVFTWRDSYDENAVFREVEFLEGSAWVKFLQSKRI